MKTQNFIVKWKHEKYTPDVPKHLQTVILPAKGKLGRKMKVSLKRYRTICTIESPSLGINIEGVASHYFKDIYNRRVGTKEAFRKAVSQIDSKDLRTELWENFKNISPKCITC